MTTGVAACMLALLSRKRTYNIGSRYVLNLDDLDSNLARHWTIRTCDESMHYFTKHSKGLNVLRALDHCTTAVNPRIYKYNNYIIRSWLEI